MMDRDNLYYAELAVSSEPPSFNRGKFGHMTSGENRQH